MKRTLMIKKKNLIAQSDNWNKHMQDKNIHIQEISYL